MIGNDDKKSALLILKKMKPEMEESQEEMDSEEESGMNVGLLAASEDIMEAIKAGDAEALSMALRHHNSMMNDTSYPSEDEEE